MAAKQYKFNPDTLTYEKVREPARLRVYRFVRKALIAFIVVCVLNLVLSSVAGTPKMKRIERDHIELLFKYRILNDRIDVAGQRLAMLRERDERVYRSLFGAEPLEVDGADIPFPDNRYAWLEGDPYTPLLTDSWRRLDAVTRSLYRQSLSLDQLQELVLDKELMATAIPATWPIDMRSLTNIDYYGPRSSHPLYKRPTMHKGIDLGSPLGTPVYATANGTVESTDMGLRRRGYGRQILIDHGFGYQTRYAHLTTIDVAEGQQVRRGEQIGTVGSTGGSTGPHLHYEVIYMGNTVDPINYLKRDMDEAEFERLIEEANRTTFETDFQEIGTIDN